MKKYLMLTKNALITGITFRVNFLFLFVRSVFSVVVIYFLWKSIFESSGQQTLNGMNFKETFLYVSLASCIYILFKTWSDWFVSREIISGNIIMHFLKPVSFFLTVMFRTFGEVITNFFSITIPSMLVIFLVFKAEISWGLNIPFFLLSLLFAFSLSFFLDYFVGVTSFFTESIWGISVCKEVVTLLLAGAVIPLPFFPETFQQVLNYLPFRAIYHIPLTILTDNSLKLSDYLGYIAIQVIWVALLMPLVQLYFSRARRVMTVNGG